MHLRKARALILDRFADGCGLEVHKKGNLLFSVQFLQMYLQDTQQRLAVFSPSEGLFVKHFHFVS